MPPVPKQSSKRRHGPRELNSTFLLRTSKDDCKPTLVMYAGNVAEMQRGIEACEAAFRDDRNALHQILRTDLAIQCASRDDHHNADVPEKSRASSIDTEALCDLPGPYNTACTAHDCVHCLTTAHLADTPSPNVARRVIVACDPNHTRLRDDCVECFAIPSTGTVVVRMHTTYLATLTCISAADVSARVAALSAFVTKNLSESSTTYVFERSEESRHTEQVGFKRGAAAPALTVECVFERTASGYEQLESRTRVYLSRVSLTHTVSDEALFQHLRRTKMTNTPAASAAAAATASPYSYGVAKAALEVLTLLYNLAKSQGWAAEERLLTQCRTTPVYSNNKGAAPLLRQRFHPDYSAQLTHFCFRHLVSRALLQLARHYVETYPDVCGLPLVCHLPFGAAVPQLTPQQAVLLQEQGYGEGWYTTAPLSAMQWRQISEAASRRGEPLLSMFAELGMPLQTAEGTALQSSSHRYTAELERDHYCVVLANKPIRDYTCLVNARCAACLVRQCRAGLTVDAAVFDAWVAYWHGVETAMQTYKAAVTHRLLRAHLWRAFPDAPDTADTRTCILEGRVCRARVSRHRGTSTAAVTVVFPALHNMKRAVAWSAADVPAMGSSVLFSVRAENLGHPALRYIADVTEFARRMPSQYVPELCIRTSH